MPNPKKKISTTRRDKRRTHYKATAPTMSTCSATGETHLRHRAYMVDGALYYRGQMVIEAKAE
jgi:large subunit ribosomal protein L32